MSALASGDIAAALMAAPFSYTSRLVGGGYLFTINNGPLKGRSGVGVTLDQAIHNALGPDWMEALTK